MNTKEFIRVQLDAPADTVRAWLENTAAAAEQIGGCAFCVVSLEVNTDSADSVNPMSPPNPVNETDEINPADTVDKPEHRGATVSHSQHRRRYGIFNGSGIQVLNASLRCPDADTTVLELRRDEAFPLMAEELMRRLDERFPGASGEVLAEKPRGSTGAPPLACNLWLEEQLRKLPDPKQYHHLYSAWLARYTTLRGFEPLDPRRSFRAAATGCLKRLRAL